MKKILIKEVITGNCPSKSNGYEFNSITKQFYKGAAVKAFEKSFAYQCRVYRNSFIKTRFVFYLNVFFENDASDLDGSFKIILDCLKQCRAIKDDKYCKKIVAEKFIDPKNPRIEFIIKPL